MAVSIEYKGDILEIKIHSSRIDGKNEIFEALTETTIPSGIEIVEIDMRRVSYINSLGIAELVSIYRYLMQDEKRKNLKFRFLNVKPEVAQLLRLVEFADLVEIHTIS